MSNHASSALRTLNPLVIDVSSVIPDLGVDEICIWHSPTLRASVMGRFSREFDRKWITLTLWLWQASAEVDSACPVAYTNLARATDRTRAKWRVFEFFAVPVDEQLSIPGLREDAVLWNDELAATFEFAKRIAKRERM